jgi:phenylalanyl-tRNA synthetase beta subunit
MDKRKFNGGNSTKAKGFDKRKNEYRNILGEALTVEDLKKVLQMLLRKSTVDEDTQAAKILLEYYIGKPQQSVDITSNEESINIPIIKFFNADK